MTPLGHCRDCRWWEVARYIQFTGLTGQCHGIPPFVLTKEEDWCSLFQPRPDPPQNGPLIDPTPRP